MLGLSEEAMRPFEFQKIPFSKHTLLAFSGWPMTTALFLPSLPKTSPNQESVLV